MRPSSDRAADAGDGGAGGDSSYEDRVLTFALWLAVAGAIVQTLVHFGNAWVWPHQRVLDVNLDEGPFTWASTVATFAGAFAAVLAALARPERAWRWWTLAGLLAVLSLDDAALLHERVGRLGARVLGLPIEWDSVIWPVVFAPILLGTFLLLFSIAREVDPRSRRFILVGLVFLALAVVAELVSAPWSGEDDNVVHTVEGAFEEALELAAWILIAAALTVGALRLVPRPRPG